MIKMRRVTKFPACVPIPLAVPAGIYVPCWIRVVLWIMAFAAIAYGFYKIRE